MHTAWGPGSSIHIYCSLLLVMITSDMDRDSQSVTSRNSRTAKLETLVLAEYITGGHECSCLGMCLWVRRAKASAHEQP